MKEVIEFIPAPLWNLVAALIALFGVLLTIFVQGRRLSNQFRHDRELKDRDREMNMKRDVYLTAAEATAAGLLSIARYVDEEIEDSHLLSDYQSKAGAVTKAYIVAGPSTWEKLMEFGKQVVTAQFRLQIERAALFDLKSTYKFHETQLKSLEEERARIIEQMRKDNIDLNVDQKRRQVLNQNYEYTAKLVDEEIARLRQAHVDTIPKRRQLAEAAMEELVKAGRAQMRVLFAMRAELELSADDQRLFSLSESSLVELRELLQKHVETVSAQVEE